MFQFGDLELSSFGFMMALGFLLGGRLGQYSYRRAGLEPEMAWSVMTWAAIGGVLGSKLWYAAELWSRGDGPFLPALLSTAGMTFYGGLIGGVLATLLCARHWRASWLAVLNASVAGLALGQAAGRLGCLLVGDDYGRATDLPWGMAFPQGSPPTLVPVHPTQIYEMLWLLAVTGWLLRRADGGRFLFGEYLILTAVGRFAIEFVRTNPAALGPLTTAQLTAIVCSAIGAAGLWALRTRGSAAIAQ
jgi:phosphatidylglycerol:prolipoprotein diacylglycerol transferase